MSKVKYKILTILFGVLLATAARSADVDKTIDAAANGQVDISNIAGSIEVYGWSKNSVEVTGELGANVEELVLDRDGDRVTVKVKVPEDSSSMISSDIVVRVPEGSSISVSGVSADIEVEDVLGKQGLHTVSGEITTQAAAADLEVASVSGDVEVEGDRKDTETKATTVSGDITLFGLSGEVQAEAVSGDVTIDEGSFDRVALKTVNGDPSFLAVLRKGGRLGAETVNGDVEIELGDNVSAVFDIDTFNGDIENCFGPAAQRTSKYAPGWELNFTQGAGEGSVTVSTMNGDIYICN